MTDFDSIDFFSDRSVVENPYPYFEYLREKCPAFSGTAPRCGGRDRLRRCAGGVRDMPLEVLVAITPPAR